MENQHFSKEDMNNIFEIAFQVLGDSKKLEEMADSMDVSEEELTKLSYKLRKYLLEV
jgi:hypothetical protein